MRLASIVLAGIAARAAVAGEALSRDDALWLERVTYGLDSTTIERFQHLGKHRFLEEQLAGRDDTLPAPVQAQIDALDISKIPAAQIWADEFAAIVHIASLPDRASRQQEHKAREKIGSRYLYESQRRHLLRAIYSPAQLKQQMDWFWLNHFSVFALKQQVQWFAADYEENAIRPHALGRFRDLVMATLTHPAMLQYLDNDQNARDHVNENYARELLELHTLGVGSGYTQSDVQQLARILTGVGVMHPARQRRHAFRLRWFDSDGLFTFDRTRHDFGDKTLLGHPIRGRGFAEVEEAVDLLVKQPACAYFISHKLAAYFVADDPPSTLVDAMALTFQHSGGNIADVLRTMFESPEFEASLGKKFKDPMHYVVSSVRLAYDGKPIWNERPLLNWLVAQAELMFSHQTPEGYPLVESAWTSSGQLSRRFEIAHLIGSGAHADLFRAEDDVKAANSALPNLAANRIYTEAIAPRLSKTTLAALAQAKSPSEWNTFLLSSPEFNYH